MECAKNTILIAVLSLRGNQAQMVGQQVLDRLNRQKIDSPASLYGTIQQLVEQLTRQSVQLSLAASMVSPQKLTLATWRGSIVLRRNNLASRLLASDSDIGMIEGSLRSGDVLVFCTKVAGKYETELCQRLADGFDISVVRQAIGHEMEYDNQTAGAAMSFMTLKDSAGAAEVPAVVKPIIEAPKIENRRLNLWDEDRSANQETLATDEVNNQTKFGQTSAFDAQTFDSLSTREVPQRVKHQPLQIGKVLNTIFGTIGLSVSLAGKKLSKLPTFLVRPKKDEEKNSNLAVAEVAEDKSDLEVSNPTKSIFQKIGAYLGWIWDVTTGKRVYLATAPIKPRRIILGILAVVVLIIAVIWLLLWWQGRQKLNDSIKPLTEELSQVEKLVDSDVYAALDQANALRSKVVAAQSSNASTEFQKKLSQELTQVDQLIKTLSEKQELQTLPVYKNLAEIKPEFLGQLSAYNQDKVVVMDSALKSLITLDTKNGELTQQTWTDADKLNPQAVTILSNDKILVLSDGIKEIKDSKVSEAVKAADANQAASLLTSFDTTLYLFNPVKRNIFRYSLVDGKYDKPTGWLIEPLGTDFENVVSMVVDGQLWLGTNQGEIKLFKSGRAQSFKIEGLSNPLAKPLVLATTPESNKLYILESQNSRVVIVDKKTGQMIKEVVSISLRSATSLLVTNQGAWAVSGSLMYQLPE